MVWPPETNEEQLLNKSGLPSVVTMIPKWVTFFDPNYVGMIGNL